MKKDIYIILVQSRNNYFSHNVSQICYDTKEKAIEFVKSRLTSEELELHNKQVKRGLIEWYEFTSQNYWYEIKVLSLN